MNEKSFRHSGICNVLYQLYRITTYQRSKAQKGLTEKFLLNIGHLKFLFYTAICSIVQGEIEMKST